MAFTAIATVADAVTAGTAADLAFGTVAAAVGEVGTTLSVVGAVTGNQSLAKIGGVMGLAGGIGSLASSAIGGASAPVVTDDYMANGMGAPIGTDGASSIPGTPPIDSSLDASGLQTASAVPSDSPGTTGGGNADASSQSVPDDYMANGMGSKLATDMPNSTPAASPVDDSIINKAMNATPASNSGTSVTAPNGGGATTASNASSPTGASASPTNSAESTGGPLSASTQSAAAPTTATNVTQGQTAGMGSGANNPLAGTGTGSGSPNNTPTAQATQIGSQNGSGMFSGIANWVNNNKGTAAMLTQLAGGAMSGAAKAYEANRQYAIQQGKLQLDQTKQANLSAQPKAGTVGIGLAKSKGN